MAECANHDKMTERIAAIDKKVDILSERHDYLKSEVQEMKTTQMNLESKIDALPEKIRQQMKPEKSAEEKKWYQNHYVLIGAVVAFIQAATKLIEKFTASI